MIIPISNLNNFLTSVYFLFCTKITRLRLFTRINSDCSETEQKPINSAFEESILFDECKLFSGTNFLHPFSLLVENGHLLLEEWYT